MKFKVAYSLTVAVIGACGAIPLPLQTSAGSTSLPVRASVNGPILVVDQRGERGAQVQIGAGHDEILFLREGSAMAPRVLVGGLTFPCCGLGGLAPSPRGRYVAFSQEASGPSGSGRPGRRTEGLWLTTGSGATPYRLLLPPTGSGDPPSIGAISWSPDRYTLAYAVNVLSDASVAATALANTGVWLSRYDRSRPRLVLSAARLERVLPAPAESFRGFSPVITALSWAPDGRTLAISVQYSPTDGFARAVLVADVVSGAVRVVAMGAGDAAFAAGTARLAYVTTGSSGSAGASLRIGAAVGQPARPLVATQGSASSISSPAWSPDGRAIAYLVAHATGRYMTLRTVDVATGKTRTILAANQRGLPLGGYFVRLAWSPATT